MNPGCLDIFKKSHRRFISRTPSMVKCLYSHVFLSEASSCHILLFLYSLRDRTVLLFCYAEPLDHSSSVLTVCLMQSSIWGEKEMKQNKNLIEEKKLRYSVATTIYNWRASCKKGVYRILADFHFLQDRANFWQTDLFWHGKQCSGIVSVNLRFILQK